MKQSLTIALAFVGLLVGAGFATGKEMTQYFVSFGVQGFWGLLITGVILIVVGAIVLQIGSFFLADEHGTVFKNVTHPRVSWIFDGAVSFTMATLGMMMLAGAGSTLNQAFGIPAWLGSLAAAVIVYFTCFLDPQKVNAVIGGVTPVMIVTIIVLFGYVIMHMPADFDMAANNSIATQEPSPVSPWWWSSLNYAGMNLMCAIGMSLVIGGSYSHLRSALVGGLIGGLVLTALLALETIIIFVHIDAARGMDIPMAAIVTEIHPFAGAVLSIVILLMIFNTALGNVYAFGRRLEPVLPTPPAINRAAILAVSWVISLIGFGPLIQIVFPILGYLGMGISVVFVAWRIRRSHLFSGEQDRRNRIRHLTRMYLHPKVHRDHSLELNYELEASEADNEKLLSTVADEERDNIDTLVDTSGYAHDDAEPRAADATDTATPGSSSNEAASGTPTQRSVN